MPLITKRQEVLAVYAEAGRNQWVLPCFCTENLTTTEAILSATKCHGEAIGIANLPVIIAMTVQYSHRTQAAHYTHTRHWATGLRLFLADLAVLTAPGSAFADLRVMVHLDHVQFDDDRELLGWDLSPFSSIMFDASKVPFDENIARTKAFVREQGNNIVIEGACDEIVDATGTLRSELTTPDHAARYKEETGVDLIVANLGTEHRALAKDLCYHGDSARKIKDRVGPHLVLHGASSVPGDQIASLYADGVCKVNLWTALERDSSPLLLDDLVRHPARVAGSRMAKSLQQSGLLGPKAAVDEQASIDYFTTVYRQDIIFNAMKNNVSSYLAIWYKT
ncbi:MAG: class II fructose-bisphosphate aldolase [Bacillota bacterium]|nr:class II fructose-bisphosphate aldolase [Bacillota bacterium]